MLPAKHGLVLDEGNRVGDQAIQANFTEQQRAWTRIVDKPTQGGRDTLGACDALLNFFAMLGVGGVFEREFQVRQDAEQRVVDLVGGAECELGERGVFFVLGELRAELDLVFVELALFERRRHSSSWARSRSRSRSCAREQARLRSRVSLLMSSVWRRQTMKMTAAPATARGRM